MLVANAVTLRGDGKARHAVHEAGSEPSEAAVAKCCVRFDFGNVAQADAEIAQRGLEPAHQLHVAERIAEQPADQEFEREIIDALLSRSVASRAPTRSQRCTTRSRSVSAAATNQSCLVARSGSLPTTSATFDSIAPLISATSSCARIAARPVTEEELSYRHQSRASLELSLRSSERQHAIATHRFIQPPVVRKHRGREIPQQLADIEFHLPSPIRASSVRKSGQFAPSRVNGAK